MPKSKIFVTVLCTLLIIAFLAFSAEAFCIAANKEKTDPLAYKVAVDNLYSDTGYIDYANEVMIPEVVTDTVQEKTFTDAQEMGLFWGRYDEETESIVQIAADTHAGAALVDPNKPTLILVHGMMGDGYYHREGYYVSNKLAQNEFGIDTETDSLSRIWLNKGWNVGYFHYERWAAEGALSSYIESKIWATDGRKVGIRYRHVDNTTTDSWTDYSVGEHFAAEYIRAMNLLPAGMGSKEIRLAAHSMGGQLTTASLFLLTELARTGQLPMDQLPNRYAMLDPFFSINVEDSAGDQLASLGPNKETVGSDITIRWSGKKLPKNSTGIAMAECLKVFEYYGIALEYYTFNKSTLVVAMSGSIMEAIQRYTSYTIIIPDYAALPGKELFINLMEGHNAVRDWYLCSLYCETPSNVVGGRIASASATYEEIIALKGKVFMQTDGILTINPADDVFTEYPVARELFFVAQA